MKTENTIHSRAMLVHVYVSNWSARKFDKKVTDEVNKQHGASKEAGRYNKNLLGGKWDSYSALQQAIGNMRRIHHVNTLPWDNDGWRLLPNVQYGDFTEEIRKGIANLHEKRDEFAAEWPTIREKARDLLNSMYRESDYPDDVASKFQVHVEYAPVPSSGDFRLDLPADEVVRIKQSLEERLERTVREAMQDAWNRLYEMVDRIRGRFQMSVEERDESERAYHVRQGLLDDARDLVDLLGRLNITDDPELEAMRQRVADELAAKDAEYFRDDDAARHETIKKADAILKEMKDIYGGPPAKEES